MLASFVRIAFVVSPHNSRSVPLSIEHGQSNSLSLSPLSLFAVTLASFVLAFLHFAVEVFIYRTASPSFASIAPLIVSGNKVHHYVSA